MVETLVEFDGVGKRFGTRTVLGAISGVLRPGRVVAVTGPNGAGKSTLLNILAGLLRPSRGSVRYTVDGRELPRSDWRERLGVAAPDMAVYDELTALENLAFFARLHGVDAGAARLVALLERVGLAPREHGRPVGTFSSGMKQRVKLAQAIVHEPDVLLLDEPSSNLDAAGHQTVAEVVGHFRLRAAVAVATNDPREMEWGDERLALAG